MVHESEGHRRAFVEALPHVRVLADTAAVEVLLRPHDLEHQIRRGHVAGERGDRERKLEERGVSQLGHLDSNVCNAGNVCNVCNA